ncbi:hypothetical protein ES708_26734 [subsurface metagenome]
MNVDDLLEKQFGVKTTYNVNPEVDLVAVKKTRILDGNPRRVSFVLINLGDVFITVSPTSDVSLTKGIYLVPHGGSLSMVWTEDFEMPTMEWYAIANGANSEIFVLEVLTL